MMTVDCSNATCKILSIIPRFKSGIPNVNISVKYHFKCLNNNGVFNFIINNTNNNMEALELRKVMNTNSNVIKNQVNLSRYPIFLLLLIDIKHILPSPVPVPFPSPGGSVASL